MEKQNSTYSNYSLSSTQCSTKLCDQKNFHEMKKQKAIENQINRTVAFIVLPFTTADTKLVVIGKEICCWVLGKGLLWDWFFQ